MSLVLTFVQKQETSSNNVLSLGTITAGNLIFVLGNWGNSSGAASGNTTSVTDTLGNTWTQVGTTQTTPAVTFGGFSGEVWRTVVTNGGSSTITFNLSAGFSFKRMASLEYSNPFSPFVDANGSNPKQNSATGTAITSGNLTTSNNASFVVMTFWNNGNTMAAASGYTQRITGGNGTAAQDLLTVNAPPGPYSFSGTTANGDWGLFLIAVTPHPPTNFTGPGQNDSGGQALPAQEPTSIVWTQLATPSIILPTGGKLDFGILYQLGGSVFTGGFGQIFPTGRS
jgi:hypothetical protein